MAPALPLDEAGQYVAGAYLVFLVLLLVYVAIMGAKVARIQRQVSELLELTEEDELPGRASQFEADPSREEVSTR